MKIEEMDLQEIKDLQKIIDLTLENKALKKLLKEYDANVMYYAEELAGSWFCTKKKADKLLKEYTK